MKRSRGFWRSVYLLCMSGVLVIAGCSEPDLPQLVDWPADRGTALLVRNVRVLDVANGVRTPPRDVRVEAGRIAAIGPVGSFDAEGADGAAETETARVVDGTGATLLPGLVDMHGHVVGATGPAWDLGAAPTPTGNLRAYAFAGVTTVFDPGDSSGKWAARRAKTAAGELIGPQIFTAGPIVTTPHGHPRAMVEALVPGWLAWIVIDDLGKAVSTDAEVAETIDAIAEGGADAIKIAIDEIPLESARMPRELAAKIVERARRHGLRTVAHVGTTENAIDAAEAGVALWVHGVYKERIPTDAIARLVDYGIPMVTTSEVFDSYGRIRQGPQRRTRLERESVPAEILDAFHPIPADFDLGPLEGWVELMEETRAVRLDNVRRLHEAGMTILAGSDVQSNVFPGASLHRELVTLVEAGLTPAEAIRAATLDPARWLVQEADPPFGLVAEGKRADLLLVDGDPTRDIAALESIRAVILNGVLIDRTPIADVPAAASRDD